MRTVFLSAQDPRNRRHWSGTLFFMYRALQKRLGAVEYVDIPPPFMIHMLKAYSRVRRFLTGKKICYTHSTALSRRYSKLLEPQIRAMRPDVIVAPTSLLIAHLEVDIPIVYVSDATFTVMEDYYSWFSNLSARAHREGNAVERNAITRSTASVFSSQWAARSAITDYGAHPNRVYVLPFGANFDQPPPASEVLRREQSRSCRLLFVGVDWQRKGGDLAFEAFRQLRAAGRQAELVMVGAHPPAPIAEPGVRIISFLDKSDPMQQRSLMELFYWADFFLLPTRNECTPIVFNEASAYGLPVIATRTGGVPDVVEDGVTGHLLGPDAGPDAYAEVITAAFDDKAAYQRMVRASRAKYESELNWDRWAVRMASILDEAVQLWTRRTCNF